jgi:hypothetical protein
MWDDPDETIHINEGHASLADDGGGKPAAVAGRGQEKEGSGDAESGWNVEEGNRGSNGNVEEGEDLCVINSGCYKTPIVIDSYPPVAMDIGTSSETPPPMRQLLPRESDLTVDALGPQGRVKEISWSPTTSAAAPQAMGNRPLTLRPRGNPVKSGKHGKLLTQLAAAEQEFAAANVLTKAYFDVNK